MYSPGGFAASDFVDGSAAISFPAEPNISELEMGIERLLNSREFELQRTLKAIVDGIFVSFRASGVAIAIQQGDSICCVASTGETAPEIGTELNVLSGISGKCFRTGESQYCYDARNDDRVDAESCRALGILSILISPIRLNRRTVGLLEVFSGQEFFFDKKEVNDLEILAGWVARTYERHEERLGAARTEDSVAELKAALQGSVAEPEIDHPSRFQISLRPLFAKIPFRTLFLVAAVFLALAAIWIVVPRILQWDENAFAPPAVTATAPTAQPVDDTAPELMKPVTRSQLKRASGIAKSRQPDSPQIIPEPEISISQSTTAWRATTANTPQFVANEKSGGVLIVGAARPVTSADALVRAMSPTNTRVRQIVPERFDASQLKAGRPVKMPLPKYPPLAKLARVQGSVVLDVTIGKQGQIDDLQVVSGHPMLTDAAVDAVKRWTYKPYELRGQPVDVETTIRINFTLP